LGIWSKKWSGIRVFGERMRRLGYWVLCLERSCILFVICLSFFAFLLLTDNLKSKLKKFSTAQTTIILIVTIIIIPGRLLVLSVALPLREFTRVTDERDERQVSAVSYRPSRRLDFEYACRLLSAKHSPIAICMLFFRPSEGRQPSRPCATSV